MNTALPGLAVTIIKNASVRTVSEGSCVEIVSRIFGLWNEIGEVRGADLDQGRQIIEIVPFCPFRRRNPKPLVAGDLIGMRCQMPRLAVLQWKQSARPFPHAPAKVLIPF